MTTDLKEKKITEGKFKCPVCDKPLKNKFAFNGHLKSHKKEAIDEALEKIKTTEELKSMPVLDVKAEVKVPESKVSESLTWAKKNGKKKSKTGLTNCIVIDKFECWHENVPVNLGDINPLPFTWGYYGRRYPVLIEKNDKLVPYAHSDMVGESCNRLFKAGHPDGFKNTFKHTNSLLQKIQLGLMVIIVIAIFFLIYILINR